MKKVISVIFTALIVMVLIAGCGKNNGSNGNGSIAPDLNPDTSNTQQQPIYVPNPESGLRLPDDITTKPPAVPSLPPDLGIVKPDDGGDIINIVVPPPDDNTPQVSICPQLAPVSPDFCPDGVLMCGGLDEHGCQTPPSCVFPERIWQPDEFCPDGVIIPGPTDINGCYSPPSCVYPIATVPSVAVPPIMK